MASEFREHDPEPKLDPYRWKSLVIIIPQALIVMGLAILEALLVRQLLAGYRGEWVQTVVFGVLLALGVFSLGVNLWRWWRRPVGEVVVGQAATIVSQLMPGSMKVFRMPQRPPSPPRKVVVLAVSSACLGLALVGWLIEEWLIVWVSLGAAVLLGGGLAFLLFFERQDSGLALGIDPVRMMLVFENFTFVTKFFQNKPIPRDEIPFDGIIDCTYHPAHKGGPASLRVRTLRGSTVIKEDIEDFGTIRALLESLAILNQANTARHQANLRAEPKPSVPVSGWVIVVVAFVGLGHWIWLLFRL